MCVLLQVGDESVDSVRVVGIEKAQRDEGVKQNSNGKNVRANIKLTSNAPHSTVNIASILLEVLTLIFCHIYTCS